MPGIGAAPQVAFFVGGAGCCLDILVAQVGGVAAGDVDVANHLKISMDEYYKLLDDVALTSLISLDQGIASNHEGLYSVVSNSMPSPT